jgi:hypothetical protein
MKKVALSVGVVFFTTVAFGQNKPDASKQNQKKQTAKTGQATPVSKTNATSAPEKKGSAKKTARRHNETEGNNTPSL